MAELESFPHAVLRRFFGVAAASALVVGLIAVAPTANADVKHRLDRAKAELAHLRDEIRAQRAQLGTLEQQAAVLAERWDQANSRYEQITEVLNQTREQLDQARARYEKLRGRLDARTRETYMQGPVNDIELVLGATSLADLSDRLEFVDALSQSDADLANGVQNLKNDLAAQERSQAKLQREAAAALKGLEDARARLDEKLAEQKNVLDDMNKKIARAEQLVKKLGKQYQDYLKSLYAVQFHPGELFKVCPVDQPRAVYDGFGAPRYAGGYHPHAGNDIVAPMGTNIRAPFDGTARASWDPLGGNAVYVYGSAGYVYNAHLSAYSSLSNGPVHAGDIIGYVGNTGDAQGGITHDHFEWHPNVIPSNWPRSPYGYSVIGTAVNPWPLLSAVC